MLLLLTQALLLLSKQMWPQQLLQKLRLRLKLKLRLKLRLRHRPRQPPPQLQKVKLLSQSSILQKPIKLLLLLRLLLNLSQRKNHGLRCLLLRELHTKLKKLRKQKRRLRRRLEKIQLSMKMESIFKLLLRLKNKPNKCRWS